MYINPYLDMNHFCVIENEYTKDIEVTMDYFLKEHLRSLDYSCHVKDRLDHLWHTDMDAYWDAVGNNPFWS